jgi:hypothetical protein
MNLNSGQELGTGEEEINTARSRSTSSRLACMEHMHIWYLSENSHFAHANMLQAALPLAVTSFVYAEEYKVHADIMSTGSVPFKYFHYLLPLFAEFQYWIY